jgi:hypothetical protein
MNWAERPRPSASRDKRTRAPGQSCARVSPERRPAARGKGNRSRRPAPGKVLTYDVDDLARVRIEEDDLVIRDQEPVALDHRYVNDYRLRDRFKRDVGRGSESPPCR